MSISRLFVLVFATLIGFAPLSTWAASVRPVEGPIILARGGVTPMYIWDASNYVVHLVSDRDLGKQGLRDIEASAVTALAQKTANASAKNVMLSVVYKPLAATSIYGKATFAGQKKLILIRADRKSLEKNAGADASRILAGKVPADIHMQVLGNLPPMH